MSLTAKETKGGDFKPVPEGVHRAVCVWLFDIGTHFNEKFKKSEHKVIIGWELPDETINIDGVNKPMMISKKYTVSLHEKSALRHDLQAWRGRAFTAAELEGFDLRSIVGKCCQIQIVHNKQDDKTYANIASIMALPKGMPQFMPAGPILTYDIDTGNEIPEGTPKWIAEQIVKSEEFGVTSGASSEDTAETTTDEVPF